MEKFQRFDDDYEWPKPPSGVGKGFEKHGKKSGEEEKQTPEEIIRDLQGIFCTGRYHSWAVSQVKRHH
jgi:anthranilate/para-aminobenzoate synthase component II